MTLTAQQNNVAFVHFVMFKIHMNILSYMCQV